MKESFFSIELLFVIAVLLTIALVGYNAFLMPEYAPATIAYPVIEQSVDTADFTVDLNTASSEELQRVPGIGPATAGRILEYRERVGVILDVRELLEVDGIGDATLKKLEPYFVIERQEE